MQPGYSSSPNHLSFLIAKVISTSKTMTLDPKQTNKCHEFSQPPTKLTPFQRILTQFAIIGIILLMMIGQSCSSSIEGPAGFIPDNHSDMRTLACFSDVNRTPARPEHPPSLEIPPTAVVGTEDGRQGSLPTSTGEEPPLLHAFIWEGRAYSTSWAPVHDRCGLHTTPACRVSLGSIHQPDSVNTVPSLQRRRLNLPG